MSGTHIIMCVLTICVVLINILSSGFTVVPMVAMRKKAVHYDMQLLDFIDHVYHIESHDQLKLMCQCLQYSSSFYHIVSCKLGDNKI